MVTVPTVPGAPERACCAWCLMVIADPGSGVQCVDDRNRVVQWPRMTAAGSAYGNSTPTVPEAIGHARSGGLVQTPWAARIPLLADTVVAGSACCWLHSGDALEGYAGADHRRTTGYGHR